MLTDPAEMVLDPKNPLLIARLFRITQRTGDGLEAFYNFRERFYAFNDVQYEELELQAIHKALYRFCETKYEMHREGQEEVARPFLPNQNRIVQIVHALMAESHLSAHFAPPCWLGIPEGMTRDALPSPHEIMACQNGLVNLPAYVRGDAAHLLAPTPLYFNLNALDYAFSAEAPLPDAWMNFLCDLWNGDIESVYALQEWFGYCLAADTRQQKMMMLIGPKRSGKGTIARILRALIGVANVCGPTLASLATNFGLWPMIGKTLAIISDARLSSRADQSAITERLLSISGEDALTIDRKNLPPITVTLPTRIMVLTNELPKLSDASGALASRFLILRLTKSFYGHEDKGLTERLMQELPGILIWAIEGWARLRDQGAFTMPSSARAAIAELDDLASPVGAFLRERCDVEAGQSVAVDDLYLTWCEWCQEQGREHAGTKQSFGRDMSAAVAGLTITQPRIGGARFRQYEGIGLRGGA